MKRLYIIIFFGLIFICNPAVHAVVPGEIISQPADSEIAYNWFYYVPTTIDKNVPIFILINLDEGGIGYDYNDKTEDARAMAGHRKSRAESYYYVLIKPAIPRDLDSSRQHCEIFGVAFDKIVFDKNIAPFFQRPDEKVILMIERMKSILRSEGYRVKEKVMLEGFSSGAMFAHRFALIHPERVQAVSSGQSGGTLILPLKQFNGVPLNWPVGINDFESLVGKPFNEEVYKNIPHYIYVGDQDVNTMVYHYYPKNDWWEHFYTYDEIEYILNTFGSTPPVVLKKQSEYLQNLGFNYTFKLYNNESTGPGEHGTYCRVSRFMRLAFHVSWFHEIFRKAAGNGNFVECVLVSRKTDSKESLINLHGKSAVPPTNPC